MLNDFGLLFIFLVLIVSWRRIFASLVTFFMLLLLLILVLDRRFLLVVSLLNIIWINKWTSFFQLLLIINFLEHRFIVILFSDLNRSHWLLLIILLWSLLPFFILVLLYIILKFLYHLILVLILSTLHLSKGLFEIVWNRICFLSWALQWILDSLCSLFKLLSSLRLIQVWINSQRSIFWLWN